MGVTNKLRNVIANQFIHFKIFCRAWVERKALAKLIKTERCQCLRRDEKKIEKMEIQELNAGWDLFPAK